MEFKNNATARQRCKTANAALIAILEYIPKNKQICLVNLHFSAFNEQTARVYQAFRLTRLLKPLDKLPMIIYGDFNEIPSRLLKPHDKLPMIICGDFNEIPSSNIHTFLKGAANFPNSVDHTLFHKISPGRLSHKLPKLESSYGKASSSSGANAKALQNRMYLNEPLFTFGKLNGEKTLDFIYISLHKN